MELRSRPPGRPLLTKEDLMGIEIGRRAAPGTDLPAAEAQQKRQANEPPPSGQSGHGSTDGADWKGGAAISRDGGASGKMRRDLESLESRLSGWISDGDEEKVLQILRDASPVELNYLLGNAHLDDMFEKGLLGWFGAGFDRRDEVAKLLGTERVAQISPANRGRLISSLQKGATTAFRERLIRDVFVGSHGAELSAVKLAVERGNDHRDLGQLLYRDIDDTRIREQILTHFAKEAATSDRGLTRLLSDIDDTFYASLFDTTYPKGATYPGVGAFYRAFYGPTSFLTARPNDRSGISEDAFTIPMLQDRGVRDPVIVGVDLTAKTDLTYFVVNEKMTDEKGINFERFKRLYPEFALSFVGDSGQGDLEAGLAMLKTSPETMGPVFIHDVAKDGKRIPEAEREEYAKKGLFVFDSYLEAAVIAFKQGRITADGLRDVMKEAKKDLAAIQFDDPAQRRAREAELRDAERQARKALVGL
jgi:hypothetical protein